MTQKFFLVFVCTLILFRSTLAQDMNTDRRQLFDDNWDFYLGDSIPASINTASPVNWRKVDLPHDWSIEGTVNIDHPSKGGGGYFPGGIGWYRKTFIAPATWRGKKISVYFEGVYMNAGVIINGKSLGARPYGYSSFSHDLSPYLKTGGENVILVKVDNSQQPNSRWYSGSGIYRHVWMIVTDPVHVAQWGVSVTADNISAKQASVQVATLIKNETPFVQTLSVAATLVDNASKKAGSHHVKIQVPANSEKQVVQNIVVKQPLLWSVEKPHLYQAHVSLSSPGKKLDETQTAFGIRSIKFSAEKGFQLNGTTVKISGGCVHHDNGCLGAAAYDRAEERKVELLKAAGFNAVRTSHNPPSEAFLNACDKLGLLVMDESFDCWHVGKNKNDYARFFNEWWKKDLEAMILRDRNHPSVIMWSTGNEIVERAGPEAVVTAKMLRSAVRELDTTRPVTSAVVNAKKWEDLDSLIDVHDIAGYNYHLHSATDDHLRVPSRIITQTESYPKDAFANWELVQDNNFIIGDFVWTAMDYLGEAGIGRNYYSGETPGEHWENDLFPWHGAYCGDIDLIGYRKPVSHYRSMLYNNQEKLFLAVREPVPEPLKIKETWWSVYPSWESWNWTGFEGRPVQVEVYSKYPRVRLFLNDQLIEEKNTSRTEAFKAVFSVPYVAGVLRAVGVENGMERESATLYTAGEPAKIKLSPDRKMLKADGQDLCFVTVDIIDNKGIPHPAAANNLHFTIQGAGTIIGVANADLKDWNSYVGNQRKAWHGKALVVIRTKQQPGEIILTVTAEGLEKGEATMVTMQNK